MKIQNLTLFFLAALTTPISAAVASSPSMGADSCQKAVNTFLVSPNKRTFSTLSGAGMSDCWSNIGSSNASLNKLNYSAGRGNVWSAKYLAQHLKELDGGNLEDSLISLGNFSEHRMDALLAFAHNGLLSKTELVSALTMLPLSLSDKPQAQLSLLKSRKNKVLHVHQKELLEQRLLAVKSIDDFMLEITDKNHR